MKKGLHGSTLAIGLMIAFIVAAVGMIGWLLKASVDKRELDNQIWQLCYESTICSAEEDGQTVILSDANLGALYAQTRQGKHKMNGGNGQVLKSVVFTFTCHKIQQTMCVEQLDNDRMRITIDGEKHFVAYYDEDGRFASFWALASIEGLNGENRLVEK